MCLFLIPGFRYAMDGAPHGVIAAEGVPKDFVPLPIDNGPHDTDVEGRFDFTAGFLQSAVKAVNTTLLAAADGVAYALDDTNAALLFQVADDERTHTVQVGMQAAGYRRPVRVYL